MAARDVFPGNRGDGGLLSVRKRLRENLGQRSSIHDLHYSGCRSFPFCLSHSCHDTAGMVLGKCPSGVSGWTPGQSGDLSILKGKTNDVYSDMVTSLSAPCNGHYRCFPVESLHGVDHGRKIPPLGGFPLVRAAPGQRDAKLETISLLACSCSIH